MRSDGDSWSIATGVGSTALLTAAARALEAQKPEPLALDPFAAVFCDAAEGDWADVVHGNAPFHPLASSDFGEHFVNFQGARTRFFDDFLRSAVAGGVRQVVIPAAGLDSRAWRNIWPADAVVYEIDRGPVLEWKAAVMDERGFVPAVTLRSLDADLRQDWSSVLLDSGFDSELPSAWLIEGLLLYLPSSAQDDLFRFINALSAPGSHVAANDSSPLDPAEFESRLADEIAHGLPPHFQLIYNERSASVASWFSSYGWTATEIPVAEFLARADRPTPGISIARDTFTVAVKGIESPL